MIEEATEFEKATDEHILECPNFQCVLCDFKSNWENGLKVHMARKHDNNVIEQLYGNNDLNEIIKINKLGLSCAKLSTA